MTYTTFDQNKNMQEIQAVWCGKKLTFLTRVADIGNLMREKWLRGFAGQLSFPLYEGATFNFAKGRIYLFLQDGQGKRLYVRDATENYSRWESTILFGMLAEDGRLWRGVVDGMEPSIGHALTDCGPELLPAVTRFPGFQRDFYDAIPYGMNESIPASFRAAAKRLHTPRMAKAFFLDSKLPKSKSIRRAFFRRPQLMFYMPEQELICGLLGDVNLYRMFLESTSLFDVLSTLHQRPMLETFFRDYARVCGTRSLAGKLQEGWRSMETDAMNYCTLSQEERMVEQKRWNRCRAFLVWRNKGPGFSVPMAQAEGLPDSYVVEGFTFRRLRTSREYTKTGSKMKNCLAAWSPGDNPVFCVLGRNGEPVAAVEVEDRTVVQIRGYENRSILLHPGLFEAYRQWSDLVGLKEDLGLELRDYDDELPF